MSEDMIERVIRGALRDAIDAIASEEINRARERVAQRVSETMDTLALGIFKQYDIQHDRNRLIITVRKPDVAALSTQQDDLG